STSPTEAKSLTTADGTNGSDSASDRSSDALSLPDAPVATPPALIATPDNCTLLVRADASDRFVHTVKCSTERALAPPQRVPTLAANVQAPQNVQQHDPANDGAIFFGLAIAAVIGLSALWALVRSLRRDRNDSGHHLHKRTIPYCEKLVPPILPDRW